MALRILIVAHDFPPLNSSASRRPYSWARSWTDLGHEVHVLTTAKYAHDRLTDARQNMSGFTVHGVGYLPWARPANVPAQCAATTSAAPAEPGHGRWFDVVRRLTRGLRLGLGLFTEKTTLAYFPMLRAGKKLLAQHRFDLLVSTSGPDMCPMVAARLASGGVKWLSDYRDLWFDEFAVNRYALTTWFVNRLQSRLIQRADAVSTVSDGLAGYIERIAPGKVLVCYNGYLGEAAPAAQAPPMAQAQAQARGGLRLVYTGTFYPGKRDPAGFFAGLALLLGRTPELAACVHVDIYGPAEEWVRAQVCQHALEGRVSFHGNVSYGESIAAQGAADLLLFIDWMDDRAEGVLTGKLFEYLACGRPILCFGSRADTEAARIITDCNAGQIATSPESVADFLAGALHGAWSATQDLSRIRSFSRRAQAELLLATVVARTGLRV